jgi:hypothetical protein
MLSNPKSFWHIFLYLQTWTHLKFHQVHSSVTIAILDTIHLLFRTWGFGGWILSQSSGRTCSMGSNRTCLCLSFHPKTETDSSFLNAVFLIQERTMDNVQKYLIYYLHKHITKQQNKPRDLSPRANYNDRATDVFRRSYCQLLRIKRCHVVSAQDPLQP